MLNSVFKKLGLDDKEIATYLQLLKVGPQPASVIARQLRLPRTTAQHLLTQLENQQLVTKGLSKNTRIYAAVHPDSLANLLEVKKRSSVARYDQTIEELKKVAPQLLGMMHSTKVIPGVKFFQGREGVRAVLFDTLTSKTPLKDYANIDAMFEHVQDINDDYVAEREKTNITKRSLLLDTPFARQVYTSGSYSPKSHKGYKWINQELYPFALEMNIYDNRVSYITYVKNDFVGVIIENEHIYKMHDSMWNLIWDLLPEVET